MSSQDKKYRDYLTKQVTIQRNVVTYRSLSREFGIHINDARRELDTFYKEAPYSGLKCSATFVISGTVAPRRRNIPKTASQDEDSYLDVEMSFSTQSVGTQMQSQLSTQTDNANGATANGTEEEDEEWDEDGEDVYKTQIVLVNQDDLEAAKRGFRAIDCINIYSLSPASLKDAGLICSTSDAIREKDRAGGAAFAVKVGRIIGKDIKMSGTRKVKPAVPAPVAGPSKLKDDTTQGRTDAQAAKTSMPAPAAAGDKGKAKEKEKEKPAVKQAGNKMFFKAPEKKEVKQEEKTKVVAKEKEKASANATEKTSAKEKEKPSAKEKEKEKSVTNAKVKEEKKEAPATSGDKTKMMFFGKPAAKPKAVSRATSAASEDLKGKSVGASSREETPVDEDAPKPKRGLKRKSSIGHESRERTPESGVASSKKSAKEARVKGRMVVSDDEDEDEAPSKPVKATRKKRGAVVDDEEEAMAIMDIDEELVEKVSRPSRASNASTATSSKVKTEDTSMETDIVDVEMDQKSMGDVSEDVDMDVVEDDDDGSDVPERAKAAAKKAQKKIKKVIPIGKNGLKKRRVIKTRKTMGKDGYFRSEDYSDYESVDEEEPEPEPKPKKVKPTAAAVKQEADESAPETKKAPAKPKPSAKVKVEAKDAASVPAAKPKAAPAKPAAKKAAGSTAKTQKGLMSFFGPKK